MTVFPNIVTLKKNAYKKSVNGFVPLTVVVPVQQEKDSICQSLVSPGDTVKEGQLLASCVNKNDELSTVYSPIPGKVEEIISCITPDGHTSDAIKIKLSGEFSYLGKRIKAFDYTTSSSDSILEKIKQYGNLNTFITDEPYMLSFDIKKARNEKVRLLVVRMFDEDPSRLTDSLIAKMFFSNVVEGANITAKALNAHGIIFVYDKEVPPSNTENKAFPSAFVSVNAKKYPAGFKQEIINRVRKIIKDETFSKINKKSLFTDSSTMLEVYRSIINDMPVIDRYVHISGDCVPASGLIKVSIGTTLASLAEQCGGLIKAPSGIIINGLVNGSSAGTLTAPVTKYVKSVCFLPSSKCPNQRKTICVRCGNCRRICPRGLSPDVIFRHLSGGAKAEEIFIESSKICDNCGLCNSVCPARLPLSQAIYDFKNNLQQAETSSKVSEVEQE